MGLDARRRRLLASQAHHIRPAATVAADALTPAVVEHVRACLSKRELIKVRIVSDDRAACSAAAERLAAEVPCEVVQQVGRVVTLYRSCD